MSIDERRDEVNNENMEEMEQQNEETTAQDKEKVETKERDAEEEKVQEPKEKTETDEEKSEDLESLKNRMLRLQADFLNYKNRTEKEKLSTYNDAVSAVIKDLLPVIDNLERAIAADDSENNNYKEGVIMVYNQLMETLKKKGLEEIEALHKPFDHNLHYGVAFEECEEYEDGTVIEVLQKGYTVKDRLIRPAMVRICRK
ncbi:MAG TPA: nucleotide exchange factor GrpE [Tissierellia bacterium]|jgi:molecular chaperone GrpE|nr:nucleotide exchange factor GrpE [Tissierellia bacterium]